MDLIIRNLIFSSTLVFTYSNASNSHILQHQGPWVSEGGSGGLFLPWVSNISANKVYFLSFEWEKTNFTTFGPFWKKSFRRQEPLL